MLHQKIEQIQSEKMLLHARRATLSKKRAKLMQYRNAIEANANLNNLSYDEIVHSSATEEED